MAGRFAKVAGMITLEGTFWFFLLFLLAFRFLGVTGYSMPGFVALALASSFAAALFVAVVTAIVDAAFVAPLFRQTGGMLPKLVEKRQITLNVSVKEFAAMIEKACRAGGFRMRKKDPANSRLTALKGFSFITSGEIITFELVELDDETTECWIESSPRSPFAYTDFGKNFRNVEALVRLLRENSDVPGGSGWKS